MIVSLFSFYVKILAIAASIALLLRNRVEAYQIKWVAAGASALVLFDLYLIFAAQLTPDYRIFWTVGRDIWEGRDPYEPARFAANPFLNPPTALALFALFATVPYKTSLVIWTLMNVVLCLGMPALAGRALNSREEGSTVSPSEGGDNSWAIPPRALAALTSTLIVTDAFSYGLFTGQLGLLTAFAVLAALDNQGRQRPIVAGMWLGLATIKVSTMLPFLILFHRRRDLRTWIALGLTCSTLCLLCRNPELLPDRVSWTLQQIDALSSPGQVNDYSFQGTQYATIIGFDHTLYRLGLRDRATIRIVQFIAVLLLGLWIARLVLTSRLRRPAASSLVALYSVLFFYHRIYDTVVLILPLMYSVGRAQTAERGSRWWFVGSAIAILLVLFLSAMGMKALTEASLDWGPWGRLVQATVTAYATWMVLVAIVSIYLGDARQVGDARLGIKS